MPVYRLDLSYDGSGFRGYASQVGQRTVQNELDTALATYTGQPITTSVAGRTDAGVHALGQVVSVPLQGEFDLERMRRGIDALLGPEITVRAVSIAPKSFNARFSASWRRYRYLMGTGVAANPLSRTFVWHVGPMLDVDAMSSSSSAFVGEHDFSSFCRAAEGRSNVRRLTELSIVVSEETLEVWVRANAFCHQMVRSIVGYLYDVGRGFCDGGRAAEVIAAEDRAAVATVAPAHGLTLWAVGYE
ncbi:MAG: tRNA pseudouridine(38-40) synthase TruA [Acidimicrobiia bacterium]